MGRRGPAPDQAKREAFARLIAEGVPSARACRIVGIHPRTGKRWRNGRRIPSGGRVLELPPVITLSPIPEKRYSARYLSEDERVRLGDLRRERRTLREIAVLMGRSPSTISRELARGTDAAGRYRPFEAQRRALRRRRLHRPSRLARDQELRDWVSRSLEPRAGFAQPARSVSCRARPLAVRRDHLPGRLPARSGRPVPRAPGPRPAPATPPALGAPARPGATLRPAHRHDPDRRPPRRGARAGEPWHWEGDLITGAGNASAIVTIVERVTRYTLLGHLPGTRHDAASVRDAVVAALGVLPAHLRRTLTWDQGTEMARHCEIAAALDTTQVHFCDPHSPWQRPSNENTNGLLRAYFPKSTDLSVHSGDDIALVEAELNRRPRRILGWDSPADRLAILLASPSVLRR